MVKRSVFFTNCRIKTKIAKRFPYFQNLENTAYISVLQIVIHFFGHIFLIKV